MTRVELVDKLAFRMKITKKDADTYLTAFLDSIMDAMVKDGRVVAQGFGSFKVNDMKNGLPMHSDPLDQNLFPRLKFSEEDLNEMVEKTKEGVAAYMILKR